MVFDHDIVPGDHPFKSELADFTNQTRRIFTSSFCSEGNQRVLHMTPRRSCVACVPLYYAPHLSIESLRQRSGSSFRDFLNVEVDMRS